MAPTLGQIYTGVNSFGATRYALDMLFTEREVWRINNQRLIVLESTDEVHDRLHFRKPTTDFDKELTPKLNENEKVVSAGTWLNGVFYLIETINTR